MSELIDYYELLAISNTSSPAAIAKGHVKQAKQWHPSNFDVGELAQEAEGRFEDINASLHILSNNQLRRSYDSLLDIDLKVQAAQTPTARMEATALLSPSLIAAKRRINERVEQAKRESKQYAVSFEAYQSYAATIWDIANSAPKRPKAIIPRRKKQHLFTLTMEVGLITWLGLFGILVTPFLAFTWHRKMKVAYEYRNASSSLIMLGTLLWAFILTMIITFGMLFLAK